MARAACRTQFTKLYNSISSTCINNSEVSKEDLIINIERLKNIHAKLQNAEGEFLLSVEDNQKEKEYTSSLEYDDKAVEMLAKLEYKLKVLNINENQLHKSDVKTESQSGVKLQKIELKKFDGKLENWLPFWEQFKHSVHENPNLEASTKFSYLSEALIGRAAASIAGFMPSESCYNDAIDLLEKEYGDRHKIKEKYIQKLLNVKSVCSANDAYSLRKLYNEISATMRSLAALNVEASNYDMMVSSVILKAIPSDMRVDFHKANKETSNDQLSDLLDFIKNRVEVLERAQLSEERVFEKRRNGESDKIKWKDRNMKGTAVGLYTTTFNKSCVFCKKTNHETKDCSAKMTIEEKKKMLAQAGRCFRCAKANHTSKFCKNQWIKCCYCNGRHISSLCENKQNIRKNMQNNEAANKSEVDEEVSAALNSANSELKNKIYLQTAKALFENDQKRILTRIVMDNGSQGTYVTEKLANILNLPIIGYENTRIISFGQHKNKRLTQLKRVSIKIKSQYSDEMFEVNASVVPSICVDVLPVPRIESKSLQYINKRLADNINSEECLLDGINMLVGQDNYWKFNSDQTEYISENLVAVNTYFGWTIQGCSNYKDSIKCVFNIVEQREDEIDLSKFWDLEAVGIGVNEEKVIEDSLQKIEYVNGRYSVSLPWKISKQSLNNNKNNAMRRLSSLTTKLLKNDDKLIEYNKGIQELVDNKIAEIVPNNSVVESIYYMPHRPVYREDKATTKMRIVFDASSSDPGIASLNDHLSSGKNLVSDLTSILIRFRCHQVALVADIEKAFLQIAINEDERDTHRFLWYNQLPQANKKLPEVIELRMTRVTFGVTSSPYLLSATIHNHLKSSEPLFGTICLKLQESFYVDDLVMSVPSEEEAKNLYVNANEIMNKAQFNLRKWNSNSDILNKCFVEAEKVERPKIQKVLGVVWNIPSDVLFIDLESVYSYVQKLRPTKRNVLRAMARIYDPLGFLGPFTISIKILLQRVWKLNLEWDQTLPNDLADCFVQWREDMINLFDFNISRCLICSVDSTVDLHIFADASPLAFGAVAYLKVTSLEHQAYTVFLCSKNRVCPIKKNLENQLTLPKLELTAALIAARLKEFLVSTLNINFATINMWTDSNITLNWIQSEGRALKPNVSSKVNEINKLTNIYDWRHCQGKYNPADLLTRGVKVLQLQNSELWKFGPPWLLEENYKNCSTYFVKSSVAFINHEDSSNVNDTATMPLFEIENYSNLHKVLRITSYVLRFVKKCRKLRVDNDENNKEVSSDEIYDAEMYWIKYVQRKFFSSEVEALSKGHKLSSESKILCLSPLLIDGVLHLSGRLPETEFKDVCNPIILPKDSHLSTLIAKDAHDKVMHSGINATLVSIRKRFWIIRGRQLVKGVVQRCVVCKRLHGRNASEPWVVLPAERISTSRPFQTTGIDFAGPLYIYTAGEDSGQKVYIMLFTCAAIRAIHLELVDSLNIKSCIDSLRRFIARRGIPETIMSDNAKTFKRACYELRKLEDMMKNSEVQQLATRHGIKWKFIPERAAWWGGFWERLVKSVKDCLKAAIGKSRLSYNDLNTLLTEVESVVNQRPLTYISSDCNDLEPLTPAHFLNQCKVLGIENFETDGSTLSQLWMSRVHVIKGFMKRWHNEYLCQLRSIHINKISPSNSLQKGDVVLIKDEKQPRLLWKLAVVVAAYVGRDGRVRACDVKTQNQILKRPIQLLYPLEIKSSIAGVEDVE